MTNEDYYDASAMTRDQGHTGITSCHEAKNRTPNRVEDQGGPRELDSTGAPVNTFDVITRIFADEFERNDDYGESDSEEQIDQIAARPVALQILLRRIRVGSVGQESTNADRGTGDADGEHVLQPSVDITVAIASPPLIDILGSPNQRVNCEQ